MKANAIVNSSLFKSVSLGSDAITSGIMICHPLKEPGAYDGIIYKQGKEIGTFQAVCDDSAAGTQADIDLYKIDINLEKNCNCKDETEYKIRPGGFLVFYASFGEGSYQVKLLSSDKKNRVSEYNTAKLQEGDVVLAMLMRPGEFEMTGYGKQKCKVSVEVFKDHYDYQKTTSEAVNIKINGKEFSTQEVKIMQGQGLVINFETEGGLNIKLIKATEIKTDQEKRHNWENPKYKYPKK